MFDKGIVLCVYFAFCASLCRCFWPKHFDILITCRTGNAAMKEMHCGTMKNALLSSEVAPSVCLLKCGCLEKLCPQEKTWLPTHCLTVVMLCEMFSHVPTPVDLRDPDLQKRQVSSCCWK